MSEPTRPVAQGAGAVVIKALTVRQGWAWGLIWGPKRIENRSWRTDYRGPLAIHAGRSRADLRKARRLMSEMPPDDELIFGAIIGVVDLVDVVPFERVKDDPFAVAGCWCWITVNPRPVEPVYMGGKLGLFDVPRELVGIGAGSHIA